MQSLPVGIQTFSSIIEGDFVYIDKTPFIWQMVQNQGRYFLSRPRRFGKSLLLDTLKELFEGNQTLFAGLDIEDKWDWTQTYPVIKLDFANGTIESRATLEKRIHHLLLDNQKRLGLNCDEWLKEDSAICLAELIKQAHDHYQQKVVVLVDEYDKPILDNIDRPKVSTQVREGLKNLYSVLKGQDTYLQFVFMTGVTKFSKVSLFSGLNQLEDLTLNRDFSAICGYTQMNLERQFAEHFQGVNWKKLKSWYNGYQFLGEAVYNPFDILLFLKNHQTYRNYWFETGSPSFLLKLFRQERYFLPSLETIEVGEAMLDSFEIEHINPITLLFQAGYLTIDQVVEKRERLRYILKLPNQEVRLSLSDQLVDLYSQTPAENRFAIQDRLYDALEQADFSQLEVEIKALFASIPWRNFTNNDLDSAEGYYASVLFAWLASLNAHIIPEDISNHGQVDLTVKLANQVFVIEIKLDKSSDYQVQTPNPALQQILDKNYAVKYQAQLNAGQTVHQIGLVFNQAARNLVQMDWLGL